MLYVDRPQGRRLLPVPQPPIEAQLDRLLRAAHLRRRREIGDALIEAFVAGADDDDDDDAGGRSHGVDELHIVHTQFMSMMTQSAVARRIAPMEVEVRRGDGGTEAVPPYEFEPDAEALLDALLPQVHQHAHLRGAAGRGGDRVGGAPAGDEGGDGQRRRHDQDAHARDEPRPAGSDHPGNQ